MRKETAVFGMGCFWGPQLLFDKMDGVLSTEVGFMGGKKRCSYEEVCAGGTGHIEVVKIEYDASIISYNELLKFFWSNHDSTQGDGQGVDIGEQYMSVIFYFDEKQRKLAEDSKKKLQSKIKEKIVAGIRKASEFYKAEEYHQKYMEKQGRITCYLDNRFAKYFR